MREILFRGKYKGNGEWLYGDLQQDFSYGKKVSDCKWISTHSNSSHAVEPKTVGEYIGVKDKNGKKIFDGDIIFATAGEYCQGVYEYTSQFIVEMGWSEPMYEMLLADELEVIGNIYDNPELVEVE